MSVVCPFSKILTGQRDGTGFPGNDKNLSRDRRSGKNGKLQSLLGSLLEVYLESFWSLFRVSLKSF